MNNLINVIIISLISGCLGTGMGGIIGSLFKNSSNNFMAFWLDFTAGIMLSIVCFDMLKHAIYPLVNFRMNIFFVIAWLFGGFLVVYILDALINRISIKKTKSPSSLIRAGLILLGAIAIHNIPEGMSIGALAKSWQTDMLKMAFLIGLHNIPEGLAISLPLIGGKMSKLKTFLISLLAGLPTTVGAIMGYFLGSSSIMGISLSLSFASGAMLCVIFLDVLPSANAIATKKTNVLAIILGIILGLVIIFK